MKLSKKGENAPRALIDPRIGQEVGQELIRLPGIAQEERLPQT
jgi:hypothetical protein